MLKSKTYATGRISKHWEHVVAKHLPTLHRSIKPYPFVGQTKKYLLLSVICILILTTVSRAGTPAYSKCHTLANNAELQALCEHDEYQRQAARLNQNYRRVMRLLKNAPTLRAQVIKNEQTWREETRQKCSADDWTCYRMETESQNEWLEQIATKIGSEQ